MRIAKLFLIGALVVLAVSLCMIGFLWLLAQAGVPCVLCV